MSCPDCGEKLTIGATFCECGWRESGKEKLKSLCIKPGCSQPWVVDHMCREHYHEKQNEHELALKHARVGRMS